VQIKSSNLQVKYSFPWRNNSCAIDAIFSCLQQSHANLNLTQRFVFDSQFKLYGSILHRIHSGETNTYRAKIELELLLSERIYSEHRFQSIREHSPSVPTYLVRDAFINPSINEVFTCAAIQSRYCLSCDDIIDSETVYFNALRANLCSFNDEGWLEKGIAKSMSMMQAKLCPKCNKRCSHKYDSFEGSMILIISRTDYTSIASNSELESDFPNQDMNFLPDIIQISESTYRLSACIYGDNNHFISIVRDFNDGSMYFHDGMLNNSQFMEYEASNNNFPLIVNCKSFNEGYFIKQTETI
jgi:hypothetical protein